MKIEAATRLAASEIDHAKAEVFLRHLGLDILFDRYLNIDHAAGFECVNPEDMIIENISKVYGKPAKAHVPKRNQGRNEGMWIWRLQDNRAIVLVVRNERDNHVVLIVNDITKVKLT